MILQGVVEMVKRIGWVLYVVMAFAPAVCFGQALGSLDTGFDGDGIVFTDVGVTSYGKSVAVQADNKIVVAGYTTTENIVIVRYNDDGSLDTTFDGDGIVIVDTGQTDRAYAVAIQGDGKIVVGGYYYAGVKRNYLLVRLNADGSLDADFDGDSGTGNGIVIKDLNVNLNDGIYDIALSGTKIVATGSYYNSDGLGPFAVTRFNADGTLDAGFDGDGIAELDLSPTNTNWAEGVAVEADGDVIVAGSTNIPGTGRDFFAIRFTSAGVIDGTWNGGNATINDIGSNNDLAYDVALQGDGKVVVAGYSNDNVVVVRYNTDGTLDTGFDGDSGTGNGIVIIDLGGNEYATSVSIDSSGKIILAGCTDVVADDDYLLIRLNTDGTRDVTFGTNGVVKTDSGGSEIFEAIAIETVAGVEKIVGAGWISTPQLGAARYINKLAAVAGVPSLQEWGLIVFAMLLISSALYKLRRKRLN